MSAPDKPEGVWIPYKPGDPVPRVPVRIRFGDGLASNNYETDWLSWGYDHGITAYMIQPGAAKATGQGGDA